MTRESYVNHHNKTRFQIFHTKRKQKQLMTRVLRYFARYVYMWLQVPHKDTIVKSSHTVSWITISMHSFHHNDGNNIRNFPFNVYCIILILHHVYFAVFFEIVNSCCACLPLHLQTRSNSRIHYHVQNYNTRAIQQ